MPTHAWVDFHTHILDSPALAQAVKESRAAHVNRWLVNSVDLDNWKLFSERARAHPEAIVGLGWHPEQVMETPASKLDSVLAQYEPVVPHAPYLGETGLDFLYGKTAAQQSAQKKVFKQFIEWSLEHGKMIQVHTRHAKPESLDLLHALGAEEVVLHWFSGNKKQQELIVENNWVCTVGPTILNSPHMDQFIAAQPIELLGLETDSPIPYDNTPSSPAWIPKVAHRVAEIKQVSIEEVARAQSALFFRFFPRGL